MTLASRGIRRAIVVALAGVLIAGGAIAGAQHFTPKRNGIRYITRPAAYSDISATVTETGTVNPVDTVQVGTQVSGTIATLNVDFNSKVTKGEVMATLDPTEFQAAEQQSSANLAAARASYAAALSAVTQDQASLRSAQASVTKAQAQLALAELTVRRDASLLQQGFIAQSQMDADQTTVKTATDDTQVAEAAVAVAQAQVRTAQAQAAAAQQQVASQAAGLRQAQYNLARTVITSPVNGIVMARNVSVGQTVAASFQTPTLFTLATNLTDMQVDTSVDEADVGNVRAGEAAQISVTAFPNVVFSGTVQQVRVNPTVVQNVVTYDAVVIVHDSSGRLFPGMTGQVTIDVATRQHVLAVPTAALLFRPLAQRSAPSAPPGGGGVFGFATPSNGTAPAAPVAGAPGSRVTLWILRSGQPSPVSVLIGISDNQNVEITGGDLHAGDPVVVAQVRGSERGGSSGGGSSTPAGGAPGGSPGGALGGGPGGGRASGGP
ncbi:MAG: biotin/lipoyl-binding protein [Bacillati bacterium ANGP1]|uniref:Biotin/lipoyl-binding protein n=1 Tax=Candidatus Segetimicrobium genomatis TaxID=2569760 RepID=A0A537JZI3_9BACT|nr:MAG: biotin/lipoyl-binding protein [Terrabacteria group bacterium ANGP1]HTD47046.1 efflux RND transporter periplasmic adaptor subunit [bacterium]